MKTAGHAVLASGVTVAISLVALVVVPVPFLRSMGIGGMLIPLVSVSVVLTLLPALLSSIGPRIDYPRIRKEAQRVSRLDGLGTAHRPPPLHRRRPWHSSRSACSSSPSSVSRSASPSIDSLATQRPGVHGPADAREPAGRDRRPDPDRGPGAGRPGRRRRQRGTRGRRRADGRHRRRQGRASGHRRPPGERDGRQLEQRGRRRRPDRGRGAPPTGPSGSPVPARPSRTTSAPSTTSSPTSCC